MQTEDDEEEDEEDEEGEIDDALLGELDDDALIDDDPIIKSAEIDPLIPEEGAPEELKTFDDDGEEDEEDLDYDSFDDRDEL